MTAQLLTTALAPLRLLSAKSSTTAAYSVTELGPGYARAYAPHAMLQVNTGMDLWGGQTVHVNTDALLGILKGLPDKDTPLAWTLQDETIGWRCGRSRGRLARMIVTDLPPMPTPRRRSGQALVVVNSDIPTALALGAVSCRDASLRTMQVFGVCIDNRSPDGTAILSTDNITLSVAKLNRQLIGVPDTVVISPDGAALLASIVRPNGTLMIDDKSIYYADPWVRCHVMQTVVMAHDLTNIAMRLSGDQIVVSLPQDRVGAFIKQAEAVGAASRADMTVAVGIKDNSFVMTYRDGRTELEETFPLDGAAKPDGIVVLPAAAFSRGLKHTSELVLDHMTDRNAVVLRGAHPNGVRFQYMIAGKRPDLEKEYTQNGTDTG